MFNEAWARQTIHHHYVSKLVQADYEQPRKKAHVTPWKTVNEVLPIGAGPGGGVVRGDGGDGSHRQRPLGGGHGEGAHHGGRTRPPPFVDRRLTQREKQKEFILSATVIYFIFFLLLFMVLRGVKMTILSGKNNTSQNKLWDGDKNRLENMQLKWYWQGNMMDNCH